MRYTNVKMGSDIHKIDIPESYQQDYHVVGLIAHNGKFIATHASLDEINDLHSNIKNIGLMISYRTPNPLLVGVKHMDKFKDPEILGFALNGTVGSKEFINDTPVCWLCWPAGHSSKLFFVPSRFFENDQFKFRPDSLGVFDVTTSDMIFKAKCAPDTSHLQIMEIL